MNAPHGAAPDITAMSDEQLAGALENAFDCAELGKIWPTMARYVRTLIPAATKPVARAPELLAVAREYGEIIAPEAIDELRMSAIMIRTWIPEVFPANAVGQVHFVRAIIDSVADVIDRALAPDQQAAQDRDRVEGRT